jgi:hypothetical protein
LVIKRRALISESLAIWANNRGTSRTLPPTIRAIAAPSAVSAH